MLSLLPHFRTANRTHFAWKCSICFRIPDGEPHTLRLEMLYLSLSVSPLMNQRWKMTTIITGGSMARIASAKASL